MKKRITRNIEWSVLICTIILIAIGIFAIYSANASTNQDEFSKQIIWIVISIPFFILCIVIDYDLISKISPIMYGISIITLVGVLFTTPISGATSWFTIGSSFSIQPSEFAKISVIMFLGLVMSRMKQKGEKEINRPTRLLLLLLIIGVPLALIIKQPDYGTATAFTVSFILMLFVSGLDKRYIIAGVAIVVVAVPLMYLFVLPEHAKTRIDVFLNPELDPRGAGYNLTQSKLAIGAGELFGMGYLKGNQTQLGFLYPKSTDFIFSVIAEELGFVGCLFVIILFGILIWRGILTAMKAPDMFGSLIAVGITSLVAVQAIINIAVVTGSIPNTGMPLPFFSYGGTALVILLCEIGVLLNISRAGWTK